MKFLVKFYGVLFCFFVIALQAVKAEEIRAGAILPLSGGLSFAGVEIRRGLEAGQKEFFPDGNLKLLFEDDQSLNRVVTVSAAQKLINVDKIHILFNSVVNSATALGKLVNTQRVPCVIVWDSNHTIANLGEYVFGMGYSTELAGKDTARFIRDTLEAKKVATIFAQDEWSEIIVTSFKEELQKGGAEVVFSGRVSLDETDMRPHILRAKQKGAQALYFPLYGAPLLSIIRQARELNFTGHLITADGILNTDLEVLKDDAEGVYAMQVWLEDKRLQKIYKERHGEEVDSLSLGFFGAGYDAMGLLAKAYEHAKSSGQKLSGEALKKSLLSVSYDGVTGLVAFNKAHTTEKRQEMLQVKGGAFERVKAASGREGAG